MKENKGIALISLVIIIVALGIAIFAGVKYMQDFQNKQKNEDIKADMLAIQSVITNIKNKHTVDETNNALIGTKIDLETNDTEYKVNEELKEELLKAEEPDLYVLNETELQESGVQGVDINAEEFYIVDYNSEEVFYSLGVEGNYKLSDM